MPGPRALPEGMKNFIVIAEACGGMRLDHALEELLPELGLRARRRLIEAGRVLVDGTPRKPAYKVRGGQQLELVALQSDAVSGGLAAKHEFVVAKRQGMFAAVIKPAGLHSAALAGGDGRSVEALLPQLFPGEEPILLNRLDYGTSGLLLVGLAPEAVARFRSLEAAGLVEKEYRAVAEGKVAACIVRNRLDTAERKRTRCLVEDDSDPVRWTQVEPLGSFAAEGKLVTWSEHGGEMIVATLLRIVIHRGARHQIRAHLAGLGHPLLGDVFYGGQPANRLFLHHCRIRFEDTDGIFEAATDPEW